MFALCPGLGGHSMCCVLIRAGLRIINVSKNPFDRVAMKNKVCFEPDLRIQFLTIPSLFIITENVVAVVGTTSVLHPPLKLSNYLIHT